MAFKQVCTFSSCPPSLMQESRFFSWCEDSWALMSSPWTDPSLLLLLQCWTSLSGLGAEEGVTSVLEEGGECNIWSPPTGTTGSKLQACCWECRGRWLKMFWWWELAAVDRVEAKLVLWSWKTCWQCHWCESYQNSVFSRISDLKDERSIRDTWNSYLVLNVFLILKWCCRTTSFRYVARITHWSLTQFIRNNK